MNQNKLDLNENSMIEAFNEAGKKILIPRAEYFNKVLPHNLQLHWEHPDELAATIINAFHDGCYTEVVEEALKRLVEIDTISERSISLYGTFLLQTKRYIEAEALFLNYLESHPSHPYVLTNLAKAQDFLDKPMDALMTLEESLAADPNQENALEFWSAIKREEYEAQGATPEIAFLNALEEADKHFGGWRTKLVLGGYYAAAPNKETALKYYEAVLHDQWEPDALASISGELGKNGLASKAIELVAPLYDPYKHDIVTGFNLLQAYLELKKRTEGEQLLKALYHLERPDCRERLSWYKIEFGKLNPSKSFINENVASFMFGYINYPLWCYGWNIKHGFDSSQTGKKIAFFQFSFKPEQEDSEISFGIENTEGQLARAIPLFLLENTYYGTDASATVILPMTKEDASYILFGAPPSNQQVMELLDQGYDGVVTGAIVSNQLEIAYWDRLTKTSRQKMIEFNLDELAKTISQIETFIFEQAEILFDPSFKRNKRGFQYIQDSHIYDYLMLSSYHLTLYKATINNEIIDVHSLIRGLLQLAKDTQNIQVQLNMISVIHLCVTHNVLGIKTHSEAIVDWLGSVANSTGLLHAFAEKTARVFNEYSNA